MLKPLLDAVMERRARQLLEQVAAWLPDKGSVLDLGSGGGKICYILAQRVGPRGGQLDLIMPTARAGVIKTRGEGQLPRSRACFFFADSSPRRSDTNSSDPNSRAAGRDRSSVIADSAPRSADRSPRLLNARPIAAGTNPHAPHTDPLRAKTNPEVPDSPLRLQMEGDRRHFIDREEHAHPRALGDTSRSKCR